MTTDLSGPAWTAPDPAELPDWRSLMVTACQQHATIETMAMAINASRTNMLPTLPSAGPSPGAIGAQILLRQETAILREAELYFATADMTSLALAAAGTPPKEPMDRRRLPAANRLVGVHATDHDAPS